MFSVGFVNLGVWRIAERCVKMREEAMMLNITNIRRDARRTLNLNSEWEPDTDGLIEEEWYKNGQKRIGYDSHGFQATLIEPR